LSNVDEHDPLYWPSEGPAAKVGLQILARIIISHAAALLAIVFVLTGGFGLP
jgi:hypothetical protein